MVRLAARHSEGMAADTCIGTHAIVAGTCGRDLAYNVARAQVPAPKRNKGQRTSHAVDLHACKHAYRNACMHMLTHAKIRAHVHLCTHVCMHVRRCKTST